MSTALNLRQQRDLLRWRREQLYRYAEKEGIYLQDGEAHRPYFVAVEYVRQKLGILDSKHRRSLAYDIWCTSEDGSVIFWKSDDYRRLAEFWVSLGGVAGYYFKKRDAYHFE